MIKPVFIRSNTLGDTWFQLLWEVYKCGRITPIHDGSFAGSNRLEFDFVSGISMYPHQRPLAPIMPEGIAPTTTDEKIEEYFSGYLMNPEFEEHEKNEHYKYAQWINGKMFNPQKSNIRDISRKKYGELTKRELKNYRIEAQESQLEWVIRHFKEKGYGNNHCYINVGDKDSNFAYDIPWKDETDRQTSPCLRGLDFKIKDNQLITHVIYRSWDLYAGWPQNMGGFTLLNEYVAEQLEGVKPGPMAFSCSGLHCYNYQIEPLKAILRKD